MVAIDIVLSTSTDQAVRKQILDISRKARRPVEMAWSEALAASGVPGSVAADLVGLTLVSSVEWRCTPCGTTIQNGSSTYSRCGEG